MNRKETIFLLSAEKSNKTSEENKGRTRALSTYLVARHIPFSQVAGSYQGVEENSFLIPMAGTPYADRLQEIKELAHYFEQESFIETDGENAYLFTGSQYQEVLRGTARQVSEKPSSEGWTLLPNGLYLSIEWR